VSGVTPPGECTDDVTAFIEQLLLLPFDAIADLLQKLIDIAAVADSIEDEVAQIFAIDSGLCSGTLVSCVF